MLSKKLLSQGGLNDGGIPGRMKYIFLNQFVCHDVLISALVYYHYNVSNHFNGQ